MLIRTRAAELPAYVTVRRADVGCSGYSRYCEYLHEIPEYSGYSHGVSRAWTRMGDTRDTTVSGRPSELA